MLFCFLGWSMSLPFIVFQYRFTCMVVIFLEVTIHWSLSFGSGSVVTLHAWYYVESLTLLDFCTKLGLGTWLETQLRSPKAALFNLSLCSFCYLPKLLEKSLIFEGILYFVQSAHLWKVAHFYCRLFYC